MESLEPFCAASDQEPPHQSTEFLAGTKQYLLKSDTYKTGGWLSKNLATVFVGKVRVSDKYEQY